MENTGTVVRRTKGFYYLRTGDGSEVECKVKGVLFKDSRFNNQIAVGDKVRFRQSKDHDMGLITAIEERHSFLSRSRVGINAEQIVAANIDNLLVVSATQTPPFRTNLVNRLLVAARVGNVKPVLVLSKKDLASEDAIKQLLEPYGELDLQIIRSSIYDTQPDLELLDVLTGHISVLAGQSGVGKSALLNKLFPNLNIRVGAVGRKTSKGSHTTTYAEMHQISKNSFVIDTPGIREFGLWKVKKSDLSDYYPLIDEYYRSCKHRDCHHVHEPQCAVKEAVAEGIIHKKLYQGYLSIYNSLPD
jgi:ribosome biogenesis GTPase / thiamine phosphate phosphatase